jgi:hypothetical protein
LKEGIEHGGEALGRPAIKKSNYRQRPLLCKRHEWPCRCDAAKQRDDLASSHIAPSQDYTTKQLQQGIALGGTVQLPSFCAAAIQRAKVSQWVNSVILGARLDVRSSPVSDRDSD